MLPNACVDNWAKCQDSDESIFMHGFDALLFGALLGYFDHFRENE